MGSSLQTGGNFLNMGSQILQSSNVPPPVATSLVFTVMVYWFSRLHQARRGKGVGIGQVKMPQTLFLQLLFLNKYASEFVSILFYGREHFQRALL